MTYQISDRITYNGRTFDLYSEPFDIYLKKNNLDDSFPRTSTANLKGYYTKWAIKNNLLYLIELESANESISLEFLFNKNKDIVAKWYTGELVIPFGEKIEDDNYVYLYIYRNEMVFQIKEGKVISMLVNWGKN